MKSFGKKEQKMIIGGILVIVVLVIAFLIKGYVDAKQDLKAITTQDPQVMTREKTDDLLAEVSELIVLPEDETPTIATVSDLEKLRGQEFFLNAEIGDKVLIYTKHKKAILYSTKQKKIIEVAPLNLGAGDGENAM